MLNLALVQHFIYDVMSRGGHTTFKKSQKDMIRCERELPALSKEHLNYDM